MADLEKLNRSFVEGDPHSPSDMNRLSLSSATYQATVEREHDDEGMHKPPFVAVAAGRVAYSGGVYSLVAHHGVASVVSLGSSEVAITLASAMTTLDWGIIAWPDLDEVGDERVVAEIDGTRTSTVVHLRLVVDVAFTFFAVDRR